MSDIQQTYKVSWIKNETYQVVYVETGETLYQGSLADCEAWLKLNDRGYL